MTFTEIVTEVTARLNLTSAEAITRVGRELNVRYKRVTTSIGLVTSRRVVTSQAVVLGNRFVTFDGIEKLDTVYDPSSGVDRILKEVTVAELRETSPFEGAPRQYAIHRMNANTVTIMLDSLPQDALDLYADGHTEASTLSGSDEPAFPESFHDLLVEGVMTDEYRKMEKLPLAKASEEVFQGRLSELRLFIAKSGWLDIRQGGRGRHVIGASGGSGGSSSVNGAASYTQTGLVTFDRSAATPLDAPFAVATDANVVTNLDADLLDGQHGVHYRYTVINSTTIGTQNAWAPTIVGDTFIDWTGASDFTLNGISSSGVTLGTLLIIRCNGAGTLYCTHNSGSAASGEALALHVQSGPTPVTNTGYVQFIYASSEGVNYWQLIGHEQGHWLLLPFAAGNFTATTGTWTVDNADETIYYLLKGHTLTVDISVVGSDVSVTPNNLFIAFPYTFLTPASGFQYARIADAGGATSIGMVAPVGGTTSFAFWSSVGGGGWSATSSDNTNVQTVAYAQVA